MPTTRLTAISKAYPFITNRIRAGIYLQGSPQAFVAEIIDTTSGHPSRLWDFPGLPRNNYGFTLDEIDGSNVVVANLASFAVVPGTIDGFLVRAEEQIRVGTTVGLVAGTQQFVFDGTGGKPDYLGWDIVPSEIDGGRGILVEGQDYSWDKTTATFNLLQVGDVLQPNQYYNIHFEPITNPVGNSYPTVRDFTIRFETNNFTLDTVDFGNKLIVEPAGVYTEVTLPALATVVEGRPLLVEIGGTGIKCVKFIPNGSDLIAWLNGAIYAMPGESFWLYKFARPSAPEEWRVSEADGNFKTVGQNVSDDIIQATVKNKQLLDGTIALKTQYARIYNEIVLRLPSTQRVSFDSWTTGNNKYLYSLADSANPSNSDKFHFPDRRGLFERNNNTGKAGDYADDTLKPHTHKLKVVRMNTEGGNRFGYVPNNNDNNPTGGAPPEWFGLTDDGGITGTETRPKNYLINKYVLL